MAAISIYLTNLGKYNEGELVGEWVDLPVDDDFKQAFEDIGINDEYEEWFITDYETDFNMNIGEYESIYKLNDIAEQLESLSDDDEIKVKAYLSYYDDDIESAIDNIDNSMIHWDCSDMGDVARDLIDDAGFSSVSDDMKEYCFDYESYGSDERYSLDDLAYDDYVYENGDDEGFVSPYDSMSDYELGEYCVNELYGGIEGLDDSTIENYFDYDEYGEYLEYDSTFVFIDDDCVEFFNM